MGRGLRNLLIGCVVLLVLACGCVGGLVVVGGNLLGLGGGVLGTILGIVEAPYSLADRPLPASPATDILLPPTVGAFNRASVSRSDFGGQQAVYQSDGVQVRVRAAFYPSAGDAQTQVATVANQTESSSAGVDPSYVRATGARAGGGARLAWSRGSYFFDVQAPSESALDRFMAAFPY